MNPRRGRPLDEVWTYFNTLDERRFECQFCTKVYSSPTSVTLRAHLSNEVFAKRFKTTVCPSVDVSIQQHFISAFDKKFASLTPLASEIASNAEVSQAAMNFFAEYKIDSTAMQSPSFLDMISVIRNTNYTEVHQAILRQCNESKEEVRVDNTTSTTTTTTITTTATTTNPSTSTQLDDHTHDLETDLLDVDEWFYP